MTAKQRAAELRRLMTKRSLSAADVGDLVARDANTVRCWRRGVRNMPEGLLRLLKLLLQE